MKRQSRPRVEPLEAKALPSMLAVSLVTNHRAYRAGEVVYMKLTEKNVSAQDVTVGWGPCIDGFSITHDGAAVWRSNPGAAPQFIADRTLAPGQSITLRAHWKAAREAGTYEVRNQSTPQGPLAKFRVVLG
jgi:Intracellular proteinase inhibitor